MANGGCCAERQGSLLSEPVSTPAASRPPEPSPRRRQLLFLILALTLIRGLLYLAIIPPWQHYDEPTHFEYVRLIAQRGRLPKAGDYDLEMRRQIASSMQAAGFWKELGTPSLDFWSDRQPYIGLSELDHPPLYYLLLAGPQLLAAHQEVETQLYLARLGSVLLYLVIVASAYGLVTEAFPRRLWLPAVVATFVALLPPVTDLMSAVNNDVGAAAAASALLWAGARLICQGPSPGRVAAVLLLTAACFAIKSTAGTTALAIWLAIGVGYLPRQHRRRLWRGLALLVPLAVVALGTWGPHAAHWYGTEQPAAPNRVTTQAPLGRSALALSAAGREHPRVLFQEVSRSTGQALKGHTVTLGAWLRVPAGAGGIAALNLDDGPTEAWHHVQVTAEWQFYAFTTTLGANATGVAASIILPQHPTAAPTLQADGVVLVDGEMPLHLVPHFQTVEATAGQWGDRPIINLLQNGSAERAWPGLRAWPGNHNLYRLPISHAVHSLGEWSRTGWVYGPELLLLFQSFWGKFAWGHLSLPAPWFYPLGLLAALSIGGGGLAVVRRLRAHHRAAPWQRHLWGVLALALLVSWGGAVLRVHPVFVTRSLFWPSARYASTAIVPTAAFLCGGLSELLPRRWRGWAAWLGLLSLAALDAVALWTVILPYYYG